MIGQQLVADVVEIPHQRHANAKLGQPVADMGHGGGGLVPVNGDSHEFRTRPGEVRDLLDGALDVGGVRIGHGLHDNGGAAAHQDGAGAIPHLDLNRAMPGRGAAGGVAQVIEKHGCLRSGLVVLVVRSV